MQDKITQSEYNKRYQKKYYHIRKAKMEAKKQVNILPKNMLEVMKADKWFKDYFKKNSLELYKMDKMVRAVKYQERKKLKLKREVKNER